MFFSQERQMWSVRLSSAARDSLHSLPEEDREAVLAAIGRLTEGPVPPGLPRPYRVRNRPDLVVLRAGRFKVAYTTADGDETITVVDIVVHDSAADSTCVPAAT
jgi:mRNA-degrading endonuclease RelE of RelBE toxin-antitoxin system